jgi:acyl CoA:acetate/3-ketoacid CoA transferase alpha subunit
VKKNKVFTSSASAVKDIPDGASILVGGFGPCGLPENLLTAVKEAGPKKLHIVTNNPGEKCLI